MPPVAAANESAGPYIVDADDEAIAVGVAGQLMRMLSEGAPEPPARRHQL